MKSYSSAKYDELRFWSFTAIKDGETCEKHLDGHVQVLRNHRIANITTNNRQWMSLPHVHGIVMETEVRRYEKVRIARLPRLLRYDSFICAFQIIVLFIYEHLFFMQSGSVTDLYDIFSSE